MTPLAQWTHSHHDTDIELTGLLNPPYTQHRPGDVCVAVTPSATNPPLDPPIRTLAIDVTVTSSPSHPSLPPATETTNIEKVHLKALRRKL